MKKMTTTVTKYLLSLSLALVALVLVLPSSAYAACTTPAGNAGDQIYNSTYNLMQFCNGTSWVNMTGATNYTETDPNVETFAKTTLPTCAAGEVLKGDGTALSCVTDVSGTTINALNDVGDVSASAPTAQDFLQFDGSNWVPTSNPSLPANSMVTGWPDAIKCSGSYSILYHDINDATHWYTSPSSSASSGNVAIMYNLDGTYNGNHTLGTSDCVTNAWSIAQLYANGRAFKFIGTNGNQISLTEISDVSASAPSDGQVLTWDNASSKWIPAAASTVAALGDLTNVSSTAAADKQVLTWDAVTASWQPAAAVISLTDISNVSATAPATSDFLQFDGTNWVNVANPNLPAGSMITGWPDAIVCNRSDYPTNRIILSAYLTPHPANNLYYYESASNASIYAVFNANGTYNSGAYIGSECNTSTITSLYSTGNAFKFIGTNGNQISLTEVSDVSNSAPASGDVLAYDGTNYTKASGLFWDHTNARLGVGTVAPTYKLEVNGTAAGTSWTNLSDRRHKKHIGPIEDVVARALQLQGVTYEWKKADEPALQGYKLGVIAQDVEKLFPEAVMTDDNDEHTKRVDYNALIAPLIEVIKYQNARIDALEQKLEKLSGE